MLELKPDRFRLEDFRSQPLTVCGKALVADQSGALYWPSQQALIVADLRIQKAPLVRLAEALDRYEPAAVIVLGRSLDGEKHASAAGQPTDRDLEILRIIQEDREWIWVAKANGVDLPASFGGRPSNEIVLDSLTLRDEPRLTRATHEIAGGLQPAARISGTYFRRPCFVGNGRRLVLPEFGSYSGGRNVLDPTFGRLFGNQGIAIWIIGEEGLYPVAARLLEDD